jgi:predicted helicase
LAKKHSLAENVVKPILYRPFDKNYIVYDDSVVTRSRKDVMQHMSLGENLGLFTTRKVEVGTFKHALVTQLLTESHAVSLKEINYLFPLYLYSSDRDEFTNGNGHKKEIVRKPNFSDEFIGALEAHLKLQFISEDKGDFNKIISALDVFHYIYALFHSPTYRSRYAEFLKMDFPRLPLTQDRELFKQLSELGEQLVSIHLMNAHIESDCYFPIKGSNIVEKVEYNDSKVYINKTQYFDNVKPNVWEFHIGGYQVCQKWLKDRKGRVLNYDDCTHYLYILAALEQTQSLMSQIDNTLSFPV